MEKRDSLNRSYHYHRLNKNLFLFFIFCAANSGMAQSFEKGRSFFEAGYAYPDLFTHTLYFDGNVNQQTHFSSRTITSSSETISSLGPFFLKYEYAVSNKVSVGLTLGYSNTYFKSVQNYNYIETTVNSNTMVVVANSDYTNTYEARFNSFAAGARINYHFSRADKFDPYIGAGLGLSYLIFNESFKTNSPIVNTGYKMQYFNFPVYFSLTAGLRYYFTKNIGAYAELGIDKLSVIQAGIALKL